MLALFCPGARYGIIGAIMTFYMFFILAAVALPAFAKAKQKARAVQMQRQEVVATQVYGDDSDLAGVSLYEGQRRLQLGRLVVVVRSCVSRSAIE